MKPELRKVAMEMLFQLYTKISNYIYDTVFQRAILEFAPLGGDACDARYTIQVHGSPLW